MIVFTSPTLLLHSRNLIALSYFLSATCPFPVVPSLNRSLTNVNSMHPKEGMIHAIPALAVRLFDALHFFHWLHQFAIQYLSIMCECFIRNESYLFCKLPKPVSVATIALIVTWSYYINRINIKLFKILINETLHNFWIAKRFIFIYSIQFSHKHLPRPLHHYQEWFYPKYLFNSFSCMSYCESRLYHYEALPLRGLTITSI